jgi:hypothetical protein
MLLQDQRRFRAALFLGVWIYSLILWAYVVVDSFLFPPYQYLAISNYVPIKQNILADIAFPVSFISFVLWAYYREQRSS